MATPYDVIYDLFLNENQDIDLLALSEDLLAKRLFLYLKTGIALLDERVYYNLSNRTDAQHTSYDLVSDGTDTIILNPAPPTGSNFYVQVGDNVLGENDYTFDGTDTITTTTTYDAGLDIYIGAYTNGQFTDNINFTVQNIFKVVMQMAHINYKKYRDGFLNFQVYGKDFNIHSPANHLGTLQGLSNDQRQEIERMIIDYDYYHADQDLYDTLKGV